MASFEDPKFRKTNLFLTFMQKKMIEFNTFSKIHYEHILGRKFQSAAALHIYANATNSGLSLIFGEGCDEGWEKGGV